MGKLLILSITDGEEQLLDSSRTSWRKRLELKSWSRPPRSTLSPSRLELHLRKADGK